MSLNLVLSSQGDNICTLGDLEVFPPSSLRYIARLARRVRTSASSERPRPPVNLRSYDRFAPILLSPINGKTSAGLLQGCGMDKWRPGHGIRTPLNAKMFQKILELFSRWTTWVHVPLQASPVHMIPQIE
jgi:hypothetical protein